MTSPPRRAFLLGAAAVASGALVGGVAVSGRWGAAEHTDFAGTSTLTSGDRVLTDGSAVPLDGLRPLAQVAADAEASTGRRLLGSPWQEDADQESWSATWVAWLLRGAPGLEGVRTAAQLAEALGGTPTSTPVPGSVVLYAPAPGAAPARAGFVVGVTRGVAQTLEGDHPFVLPHPERFVRRLPRPGAGSVSFLTPAYPR